MAALIADFAAVGEDKLDTRECPAKIYMTSRYTDYSFEDETSQFDPKGVWVGGCEYYSRTYRCRVPRKMLERAEKSNDFDKLNDWLCDNSENDIYY